MLVGGRIFVELKAIKALQDIHFVVVRSYLRAAGCEHGLLLFAKAKLQPRRVIARTH
jgi:GxxExxY protein